METAVLAYIAAGKRDRAVAIARRLDAKKPGDPFARPLLMADAVVQGQFDRASDLLDFDAAIPLAQDLTNAWVRAGAGKMSDALADFRALAEQPGLESFVKYHLALALAWVGDMEGAETALAGILSPDVRSSKRPLLLYAQVLAQLDRSAEALPYLETNLQFGPDAAILAMREAIEAGHPIVFDAITGPSDGVAEVYHGMAQALNGEADDLLTLTYSRLAEYLRPDLSDATLLSASLLESMGQFDLATEAFDRISSLDPAYFLATLGRANAMRRAGREEDAVKVLTDLTQQYPNFSDGFSALGDSYRRLRDFDEASQAYDRAIALIEGTEADDWFLYYVRGITHEQVERWELAEADFRRALELNPDQPDVLNYLGYSYVEMQTNLDEALDMIRRAVDLRPRSGYVTDSLGWVYYRLGRYDEAVQWMEQATRLMPVDPVINDHLGDVYWAVGRKREAQFQWTRAMSFDPDEADAGRIRRKLEIGLDAVLREEGAPPLHAENDG